MDKSIDFLTRLDFLTRFGGGGEERPDLAEAAIALAALDRPDRDPTDYLARLDRFAAEIGAASGQPLLARDRAEALAGHLFRQQGFTGDETDYDNLDNANLMAVIDRRRGLPVALSIIYIDVARRLGWPAVGLNFPNHFVLRLEGQAGDRVILDPFHDGAILDAGGLRQLIKTMAGASAELEPEFYQPVSDREILIRLQNNIRARALGRGDLPRAVTCLEGLVCLDPTNPSFWYELGILEIHRNRLTSGRNALENCLLQLDSADETNGDILDLRQRALEKLSELSSILD